MEAVQKAVKNLIDMKCREESQKAVFENRIGRQRAHGFDPFLSPKEAAEYLGTSVRFIYERISCGELESQPMGRLRRIRLSTLETWLVRQQNGVSK
jgi:excisionase family DNA binding protein